MTRPHLIVDDKHRQYFPGYVTGELLENRGIVRTLALAQHHGIPTVLLDWTYSPLAAAFFAAEGAWQKPGEASRFAVFGVHRSIIEADEHISRITLPPNTVSFLDAQEGLFLWCPTYYAKFLERGTFPDFETLLEDTARQLEASAPQVGLVKYTLPAEHAKDVLRMIWHEKVSPAHLRPSLDNVTAAIKMRSTWLIDEKPSAGPDVGTVSPAQPTQGLDAAVTSNVENRTGAAT
jgi:FRG domain